MLETYTSWGASPYPPHSSLSGPSAAVSAAASNFGAKAVGATVTTSNSSNSSSSNATTVIAPASRAASTPAAENVEKDSGVVNSTHMYTGGPTSGYDDHGVTIRHDDVIADG